MPQPTDSEPDCFSQSGLPRRFGRYLLLRLLARGGMGQVFLASTTGVEGAERPVVVKVIRREHAKDPNFLARFLDEARVQSQLVHSGVAQVLEADRHEPTGDPYVVMEYVEGKSLGHVRQRIIEVGHRLPWEDAVAVATLVTEALAHVHERRDPRGRPLEIVHRDLSPHNVMLGYSGDIKIIDFGTARGQNRRCHTVAGVVFAKPGYVAPEVANGDSGDARVDLYAVGIMLWELLSGRRFLQGEPAEHLAAVAKGAHDPPAIAALAGAPPELDEIIAKLTAFDREDRYESARVAAAQLGALLSASAPLPNGERGVRARAAQLMYGLYPDEPGKSRRRFQRLVAAARKCERPWESASEPPPAPEVEAGGFELLPGSRYRLRGLLGRGASSMVYEAEHVDLGRRVAIKVLAPEHTDSREFAARFRKEARALSRLAHPGLVRVYDFGQTPEGRLYSVMELLEGRSLRTALDDGEPFTWRRALRVAHRCCMALQVAHESGVVHRDIKPANIFVSTSDRIKLIDFGLAKTAEEVLGDVVVVPPGAEEAHHEGLGRLEAMSLFGTPEYMAPEQIAGGRVDYRADLYGLGCVLYEMLTGSLPFPATSPVAILEAKLEGSPESARERAPGLRLPRNVNRIVMKALARHPSRRFRSALAMAEAIEQALDEPGRRRARRRAVGSSVAAGVMAFAVVLLGMQLAPVVQDLPAELRWGAAPPARDGLRPVPAPPGQKPPAPQPIAPGHVEPADEGPAEVAPDDEEPPGGSPALPMQPAAEPVHVLRDEALRPGHDPSREGAARRIEPVVLAAEHEEPDE